MGCDTSIPPPPPYMWPVHCQLLQQQLRNPPLSQPLQQQRPPLGYSTGPQFVPPFQLGNLNRPAPQVPLGPPSGPSGFFVTPRMMDLQRLQAPSRFLAPLPSDPR